MEKQKLIFEEQWFVQLFKICHDEGLDWTRMAAIIYIKSQGDIQKREIDWGYISDKLGPDNPTMLGFYDKHGDPGIEIIDRGTKWGLFQIYGNAARLAGYNKQLVGLASTGAGIKYPIQMLIDEIRRISDYIEKLERYNKLSQAQAIKDQLPNSAERNVFDIDPDEVTRVAKSIKEECKNLALDFD